MIKRHTVPRGTGRENRYRERALILERIAARSVDAATSGVGGSIVVYASIFRAVGVRPGLIDINQHSANLPAGG